MAARTWIDRQRVLMCVIGIGLATAVATADDPDWGAVPLVRHSTLQAVDAGGGATYPSDAYPLRVRGIVLNNPEDWLDPTPAYDPDVHLWEMGGQWEIFVQVYDDPNESYDDADFGGTACWMGQNYGNHIMHQDPWFNYTDAEWISELDRLDYSAGTETTPVRAGDWIEIRARAGLFYLGKSNINEQHNNDRDWNTGEIGTDHDFEVVVLQHGFGLPAPAALTLGDLKHSDDAPIFDPTRATGGEHYQLTRVAIEDVTLDDAAGWGADTYPDLLLLDDTTRSLTLHLGRDPMFDKVFPPTGSFTVTGILTQEAEGYPPDFTTGYYLIAVSAADFDPPLQVCGDANCDGVCDYADIDVFVEAISHIGGAGWPYPCPWLNTDLNYDGNVTYADIDPFVQVLSSGGFCP